MNRKTRIGIIMAMVIVMMIGCVSTVSASSKYKGSGTNAKTYSFTIVTDGSKKHTAEINHYEKGQIKWHYFTQSSTKYKYSNQYGYYNIFYNGVYYKSVRNDKTIKLNFTKKNHKYVVKIVPYTHDEMFNAFTFIEHYYDKWTKASKYRLYTTKGFK